MSNKEEIEAAVVRRTSGVTQSAAQWMDDDATFADAYISDRDRQHHESTTMPTRELFERLKDRDSGGFSLVWGTTSACPLLVDVYGNDALALNTIAKLRAACLLLGIDWPEEKE